jgi:hypothetical protein
MGRRAQTAREGRPCAVSRCAHRVRGPRRLRPHARHRGGDHQNYRGGHTAAKASSGFSRHGGITMRVVGTRGAGGAGGRGGSRSSGISLNTSGRKGGRGFDPRVAEELFR